jgi:hypothetical protein
MEWYMNYTGDYSTIRDYDYDNVFLFIYDGGDLYHLDDDIEIELDRRFTKEEAIAFAESNGYNYQFKEV